MKKCTALTEHLADRVGFEPTVPLLVHLISSQGRYNHFDTAAYSLLIISESGGKIKVRNRLISAKLFYVPRSYIICKLIYINILTTFLPGSILFTEKESIQIWTKKGTHL